MRRLAVTLSLLFAISHLAAPPAVAKSKKKDPPPEPTPAAPEVPPSMFEHVSTDPFIGTLQVQRWRLKSNDLDVLLVVDRSSPTFSYHTYFDVGSGEEKEGKTGIAHLFEHLMFKGTDEYKDGQFSQMLEEAGGADLNAWTWLDITAYHVSLPKEKLPLIVGMESARMDGLVLDQEQLDKEREVVINERRFRVDNDPDGKVNEELWALAFEKNTYHWSTIGWQKDLEGLTVDDLKAFYKDYYAPNNATIVVVGDIDPKATLDLIEGKYGGIPASQLNRVPHGDEPDQTSMRKKEMNVPVETEALQIGIKAPALTSPDWAAVALLDSVLTAGNSARLPRRLIDSGLASDVGTMVPIFQHEALYEIQVSTRAGKSADAALAVILDELKNLQTAAVPTEELERARNLLLASSWSEMASNSGKAGFLGFNEVAAGGWKAGLQRIEAIRKVSAEDVQRVAATWIQENRASVIVARPEGAAPVAWKAKDLPKPLVLGPALKTITGRPVEGPPSAPVGEVQERTTAGWTRLMTYDPSVPMVWFQVVLPHGSAAEPTGKDGLANVTAELLLRGTMDRPRESFERALEGLGATVEASVDVDSIALTGSVLAENWPKAAALITEALQFPALREEDLSDLLDELKAELVDERNNDAWLARSFLARHLLGGTPYGRNILGTTASLGSITRDDVSAFYRTWFSNQGAVIGLLGAFDAGSGGDLARLAGQLPGNLPEAVEAPVAAAPVGRKLVFVDKPGRTQVQYVMGHLGPSPADPAYPATILANEAFGGGGFGAILMQEIREKRGWSYGAYSALKGHRDVQAVVINYFPANKDAVDCLKLGLELWEGVAAGGITTEQLEYARSSYLNSAAFITDTGAKRLSYEIRKRIIGFDPLAYLDGIRAATLEEVQAAAQAFFHPKDVVIVVVGSTVKAPKKGSKAQPAAGLVDIKPGLDALIGAGNVTVVPYDRE